MMSVRCGYCYEVGHNRRTCPSYKKNLKRAAENGNPYAKEQLNKKIVRTCGYCSRSGHDKRTCEYLKRDTNRLAAINLEVRKRIQKKHKTLILELALSCLAALVTGAPWIKLTSKCKFLELLRKLTGRGLTSTQNGIVMAPLRGRHPCMLNFLGCPTHLGIR